MAVMQIKPAPRQDWRKFYSDNKLRELGVPAYNRIDPSDALYRHPILIWSEIKASLKSASAEPSLLMLVCDVLILDEDLTLGISGFIFARRIELAANVSLTVDRSSNPKVELQLVVQNIVKADTNDAATLPFACVFDDSKGETQVSEEKILATYCRLPAWALRLDVGKVLLEPDRPCDLAREFLTVGSDLRALLDTQFILASLVFDTDDGYTLPMLEWVAALAAENTENLDLAIDAHALHSTLRDLKAGRDQNSLVVPALDHTIYEQDAKAWASLLEEREKRLHDIERVEAGDQNWSDQVELLIKDKQNDLDLTKNLLTQAENTRAQVAEARQLAATKVQQSQDSLIPITAKFEIGIHAWKRKQDASAAIDLVVNSAELLVQIPTIFTLAPQAAAMPAVQTAAAIIGFVGEGIKSGTDYYDFTRKKSAGRKVKARLLSNANDDDDDDDDDDNDDWSPLKAKGGRDLRVRLSSFDGDGFEDFEDFDASQSNNALSIAPLNSGVVKAAEDAEQLKAKSKEMKAKQQELLGAGKAAGKAGIAITKNVMQLMQNAANANNLEATSEQLIAKVSSRNSEGLKSIDPIGIDVVTGGKQIYDQLELEIKELIRKAGRDLFLKIDKGAEFEQAMMSMLITGRAMCMARLALAKANSDLAAAKLREQSAEKALKLFRQRKKELNAKVLTDVAFKSAVFRQTIELRRSVFLALEAYRRAVKYYTLMPDAQLPVLPRITDSVYDFNKAAKAIAGRKLVASALNSLYSGFGTLEQELVIDAPETLALLRSSNGSLFPLPPFNRGAKDFNGMCRIRLSEIEIRLEGLELADPVEVHLITDGQYKDKDTGRADSYSGANFISKPMSKLFKYTPGKEPSARTNIPERFADDFFKPTPFSQWRISVTNELNEGIDLSAVTAIKIKLIGDFAL